MYRKRKLQSNYDIGNRNFVSNRSTLNTIDEDATIKIPNLNAANADDTDKVQAEKKKLSVVDADGDLFASEDNIPLSQEPTQRYLSQRSIIATTLGRTQSAMNASQRPPDTYFELVLMKAGVQLDDDSNFVLACDHITFVCKLRNLLNDKNHTFSDHIQMFKSGLRTAWPKLAFKILNDCRISVPGEDNVYQSQDNMIVNFFMIDPIRDIVVELLLEKIEEAACGRLKTYQHKGVQLLPLMLTQLHHVAITHSNIIFDSIKRIIRHNECTDNAKMDIILRAEILLIPSKHDEFVELLMDNMKSNNELMHNTYLQAITNLSLSDNLQMRLRNKIIDCLKTSTPSNITIMPFVMKFFLKILVKDNEQSIVELIKTLRGLLSWDDESGRHLSELCEQKTLQLELFACIEQGLVRSKKFYTIWQKTIASLAPKDFRGIDFIMILLLIHVREDNSITLENILKRHVNQLNSSIIQAVRSKFSFILEHLWPVLMQILNNFLSDKRDEIVDFARLACGCFFEISKEVQKIILRKLVELTTQRSAHKTVRFALHMMRDLWKLYPKVIHKWGVLLLPLLDYIPEMSLYHTRTVMELLSYIAYPLSSADECSILQDQIDMLIKKQLINRNLFVKKQGIIASVQVIDCIARIDDTAINSADFETSFNSINDLPDGRGKIAANYIVRIQTSARYSPELLALFFDELSAVCCTNATAHRPNSLLLDKSFLIWLCELMTYYFQNSFVVEQVPENNDGMELTYQKCINSPADACSEEPQSELPSIAVNIGGLITQPSNEAMSSVLVLCPLFKLVRVLQMQRYEGSLEIINALLGCAIILPQIFKQPDEIQNVFEDYNDVQQKQILDIYYYTINWLRETISSFATQREQMIRRKILQRLAELIKLEQQLKQLLLLAPNDYTPPQYQFITTDRCKQPKLITQNSKRSHLEVKSASNAKGRSKSDNTEASNVTCLEESENPMKKQLKNCNKTTIQNIDGVYGAKEIYRQMDTNILLVLKESLNVSHPLPTDKQGQEMGLLEYRFILNDIISKLEWIVGIRKFSESNFEQDFQYLSKPEYFIYDLKHFIATIKNNMNLLFTAINTKLRAIDYNYSHADIFTDEFNLQKLCFGLSLRLLVALLSWSMWHMNVQHSNHLREILLKLIDEKSISMANDDKSLTNLSLILVKQFLEFESIIVDLKSAVYLHQLVMKLVAFSTPQNKQQQLHKIRKMCSNFIGRRWCNYEGILEKGGQCNTYLNELLKGCLKETNFQQQRKFLSIISSEIHYLNGKDPYLKSFPNIKKTNFPLMFRCFCEALISTLHQQLNVLGKQHLKTAALNIWESSCLLLNELLEIVQSIDIARDYQIFLKYSHMYIKLVMQHGLSLFEQQLKSDTERVCELIKNMQTTTRFLHHLCCQSKVWKNTAIIAQIPALRETVENFVYLIKALLTANKCTDVFIMGNLKNKDLNGCDIVSQVSSVTGDVSGSDSEEDMPPDDLSLNETGTNDDDDVDTCNSRVPSACSNSSSRSKCY